VVFDGLFSGGDIERMRAYLATVRRFTDGEGRAGHYDWVDATGRFGRGAGTNAFTGIFASRATNTTAALILVCERDD